MEIRAALGRHFIGFDTGRWDYINSVADALAWDPDFINPNIDAITMTYGYMRHYEDRVRRAMNTPDRQGQYALWQGGMEPNIPVGSTVWRVTRHGARGCRRRAANSRPAPAARVAHWKMVHIVRPVWEQAGQDNQLGPRVPQADLHRRGRSKPLSSNRAAYGARGARPAERGDPATATRSVRGFVPRRSKPADSSGTTMSST
jgi:malate synthase